MNSINTYITGAEVHFTDFSLKKGTNQKMKENLKIKLF